MPVPALPPHPTSPLGGLLALLACLASPLSLQAAEPIHVIDASGARITLAQPARRIVSIAPHLTETLYAAGAGALLVGAVDYSDYPPEARQLPRVGGYSRVDLERVAALKPDLIIGWQSGNAPAQIERLRGLGIPLYLSQPDHIAAVADELEALGTLAGSSSVAQPAAAAFRARLAALRSRYADRPRVRTFYQVWNQPLMTVGGRQIISDVIRLCGGDNVFAQLSGLAPAVSEEAVLASNPEVIIASGMDASRPEWLDSWRRWSKLQAVVRDNLFHVPPEQLQRHTPRLLDGAEQLCRHLDTARSRRPASVSPSSASPNNVSPK